MLLFIVEFVDVEDERKRNVGILFTTKLSIVINNRSSNGVKKSMNEINIFYNQLCFIQRSIDKDLIYSILVLDVRGI